MSLYKILLVKTTASHDEIVKAHRKLLLKYHPDRLPNPSENQVLEYHKIQEAYRFLSNDTFRQLYQDSNWDLDVTKTKYNDLKNTNSGTQRDEENHIFDFYLNVREALVGGEFACTVPIYYNSKFALTYKTVMIDIEPCIAPYTIINLVQHGIEHTKVRINICQFDSDTTCSHNCKTLSAKLVGVNDIFIRQVIGLSDIHENRIAFSSVCGKRVKLQIDPTSFRTNNIYEIDDEGLKNLNGDRGKLYLKFEITLDGIILLDECVGVIISDEEDWSNKTRIISNHEFEKKIHDSKLSFCISESEHTSVNIRKLFL